VSITGQTGDIGRDTGSALNEMIDNHAKMFVWFSWQEMYNF